MAPTHFQAKIAIGKLIQLAYSEDGKRTASIVATKGNFTLVVDETGKATLRGMTDHLTFSGNPALKSLGFKIKRVSIDFTPAGDGRSVNYSATYRFAAGTSISVSGNFDIFEAIKSCSGLLCRAARLLDGRHTEIEQKLAPYFH